MAVDVLVTGAAGVLGSQIVETLRTGGKQVAACGRVAGNGIDAAWDIAQSDGPKPDCEPHAVVHSAAETGSYQGLVAEATSLFDVNVTGTLRVLQWCVARGVKQVVLISGAIVYGEWTDKPKDENSPVNPWVAGPYAVSKLCSEQVASLLNGTGTTLTILRLSSLYGPGYKRGLIQRLITQGRETGSIKLRPPLNDSFDLLHVDDAAQTVAKALQWGRGGLWNVGGSLTTIQTLAKISAEQVGVSVSTTDELPERHPRILNWVNDEKARAELGHANETSVESGITAIARQLQEIQK